MCLQKALHSMNAEGSLKPMTSVRTDNQNQNRDRPLSVLSKVNIEAKAPYFPRASTITSAIPIQYA